MKITLKSLFPVIYHVEIVRKKELEKVHCVNVVGEIPFTGNRNVRVISVAIVKMSQPPTQQH